MLRWLRAMVVLAAMIAWALPAFGEKSAQCELTDFAPPASLAVTKGQVIGAEGEHVLVTRTLPREGADVKSEGYLLTGDKVDFVTACRGYSYVRYHGADRTTAGWIDSGKLQLRGPSFIPFPPNASQLCAAAQHDVNNKGLTVVAKQDVPEGLQFTGDNDVLRATALKVQHIVVQGRRLAVLQVSEGGTCYSDFAQVWTGDLKHRLSPDDIESRNPTNLAIGGNAWAMALSEDVVVVDRQPLIRSSSYRQNFELSTIDRTGDTQLLCHGRLLPLQGKPVVEEGDTSLCEALPLSATPVVMQSADGKFSVPAQKEPETRLEARQWGMFDLDNTGHDRPIGVVDYSYSTGRGCGGGFELQIPVVLKENTVSPEQVSAALQAFHGDSADNPRPSEIQLVRIVRFAGQTYVEMLDAGLMSQDDIVNAPVQSVWKFGPNGARQVCKYQTRHYEVKPPGSSEKSASD